MNSQALNLMVFSAAAGKNHGDSSLLTLENCLDRSSSKGRARESCKLDEKEKEWGDGNDSYAAE